MKPLKVLIVFTTTLLFSMACMADVPLRSPSTDLPPETPTMMPFPTQARAPSFLSPTLQALPFPAWVKDFANPILVSLDDRRPDFRDDFTQLNKGWFYFISGNRRGPFYAHLQDGTLLIKLPEGKETRDSMVYNPKLIRKNFVLNFSFQFEETQPPDLARFQFSQAADQSVAFDILKNKTWELHWGSHDNWQSITGTYDYFPPERIDIQIMMQGDECAVFLNDAPIAYASDCRPGAIVRASPWAVTFHTISTPRYPAAVSIDNLKLWDLDKIPALP